MTLPVNGSFTITPSVLFSVLCGRSYPFEQSSSPALRGSIRWREWSSSSCTCLTGFQALPYVRITVSAEALPQLDVVLAGSDHAFVICMPQGNEGPDSQAVLDVGKVSKAGPPGGPLSSYLLDPVPDVDPKALHIALIQAAAMHDHVP